MKAAVYTRYGPPEVLHIEDVATPRPGDDEVLIRVHAATVNRTDCGFLRAYPFITRLFSGLAKPRNTVLGNEFAGMVEAVGGKVTSFKAGDRVFGYDDTHFGAHAQFKTMAVSGMLATIPPELSYEEIAPATEGAHYALTDIRAANVQPGQRVLIYGATGAIGSAAVQLARHAGARVTGVCATKDLDLVASLGADTVVDYTREDFTKSDERYDFVFDAVGKSSFGRCQGLLKPHGIYCSTDLGARCQNPLLALWTPLHDGKKVIFPIPKARKPDIEFLRELIQAGKFKPVVDRAYPLDQVVEAFRYVETGQKTGNVVITIPQ